MIKLCRKCGKPFTLQSNEGKATAYCAKHRPSHYQAHVEYLKRLGNGAVKCKWCGQLTTSKTGYCTKQHKEQAERYMKHEKESEGFYYNPATSNYSEHTMPRYSMESV